MPLRVRTTLAACLLAPACLFAATTPASAQRSSGTGGVSTSDPRYAPTKKAKIVNGVAIAPKGAPEEVVDVINAGNRIIRKPYRYGGGHQRFEDSGYDCSGSVSYALHGGGLLSSALTSGGFMSWGAPGKGNWITVYAHGGHAYLVVAGIRLDTGYRDRYVAKWGGAPGSGPRWGKPRNPKGFTVRHPAGF